MCHPTSDDISAWAGLISATIAAIAFILAVIQFSASKKSIRESTAIQAYQAYLRSCSERPHLSSWSSFSKWSKLKSADGITGGKINEKTETYLWFVSEMLYMCQLVSTSSTDAKILRSIKQQIFWHLELFEKIWEDWRIMYPKETVAMVDDVLKNSHKFQG